MNNVAKVEEIRNAFAKSFSTLDSRYFIKAVNDNLKIINYAEAIINNDGRREKITILDIVIILKNRLRSNEKQYRLLKEIEEFLRDRRARTYKEILEMKRRLEKRRGAMTLKNTAALAAHRNNLQQHANKAAREAKPPIFRPPNNNKNVSKGIASRTRRVTKAASTNSAASRSHVQSHP